MEWHTGYISVEGCSEKVMKIKSFKEKFKEIAMVSIFMILKFQKHFLS
jgi:hypothetical protein